MKMVHFHEEDKKKYTVFVIMIKICIASRHNSVALKSTKFSEWPI